MKSSRYATNSLSDVYASYLTPGGDANQKDDFELWSLRNISGVAVSKKREDISVEPLPELLRELTATNAATVSSSDVTTPRASDFSIQRQKIQEASSVG